MWFLLLLPIFYTTNYTCLYYLCGPTHSKSEDDWIVCLKVWNIFSESDLPDSDKYLLRSEQSYLCVEIISGYWHQNMNKILFLTVKTILVMWDIMVEQVSSGDHVKHIWYCNEICNMSVICLQYSVRGVNICAGVMISPWYG